MNWFAKLLNNPNTHIIGALASGAASVAFPAYAGALQVAAAAFAAPALALPGGAIGTPTPIATPPVIALPPAAAGGFYHAVDYANLAAALLAQFAKPEQPGRS